MASKSLAPVTLRPSNRLRFIRIEAGLSVEQLAERSGLPVAKIECWENGGRGFTTCKMKSLADALGCYVVDFFQDEDVNPLERPKTHEDRAIIALLKRADDKTLKLVRTTLLLRPANDLV